jgi:hypothetical protein
MDTKKGGYCQITTQTKLTKTKKLSIALANFDA